MDLDVVHEALMDGRLGGAALDVLPVEPIDYAHPLLHGFERNDPALDGRLVITPHAAFFSPASIADMRRLVTETVMGYLREGRLRSCVNAGLLSARG